MADPTEPERHTCPRRMSDFGPWERSEGLDTWDSGGVGLLSQAWVGLSCSFCGSLHPDRFMELVREGWIVGPTDKGYKAYLARPLTDEEKAAHKQRWLDDPEGIAQAIRRLAIEDGKSPEQADDAVEREWAERLAPLTAEGTTQAKFYYQHLSSEQRDEFIALYNGRTMRVGYPGYFYRLPFFCTQANPGQEAVTD